MGSDIIKYHLFPRVVRANRSQVITAIGLDESSRFYDDCDYYARVYAMDDYNFQKDRTFPGTNEGEEVPCRCKDGVVTFEYLFTGEQEWSIQIFRKETVKHRNPMYDYHTDIWQHLINAPLKGIQFRIYSLNDDLYFRKPLKGDLHIHTGYTDGEESAEMTAALYRKAGYDFIGITDHHTIEPSLQAIAKFRDIPTSFKIYPGEEVHNGYKGYFHMVNFNCKHSVCERILHDRAQVEREIDEIEADIVLPDGLDRREMAWRTWIHKEIRKSGGISILPHPYAVIGGVYNVQTKVSNAVFSMGLCDAFEAASGSTEPSARNNQAALYYEAVSNGFDLPVVGSSDSHTATERGNGTFDISWTIVFAQNVNTVTEDILNHYSVAVDNIVPERKQVYGRMRLVKYAWFLIENYYPFHDALCQDTGRAILRYVFGDKTQHGLISLLEAELQKFNDSFFGARNDA